MLAKQIAAGLQRQFGILFGVLQEVPIGIER